MITLQFGLDEHSLILERERDTVDVHAGILEETGFLTPMRFAVDGLELLALEGSDAASLDLPLIGFASHLFGRVSSLEDGSSKKLHLAGGGALNFARSGDVVTIHSSIATRVVNADYGDLCAASESLLRRVRDAVLQSIPDMRNHPAWADWFPE